MKITAIIFLGLLALTSCYAKMLESICKQGPEVYCATEENAAHCHKLEFCTGYNEPAVHIEPKLQSIPKPTGKQWYWWG